MYKEFIVEPNKISLTYLFCASIKEKQKYHSKFHDIVNFDVNTAFYNKFNKQDIDQKEKKQWTKCNIFILYVQLKEYLGTDTETRVSQDIELYKRDSQEQKKMQSQNSFFSERTIKYPSVLEQHFCVKNIIIRTITSRLFLTRQQQAKTTKETSQNKSLHWSWDYMSR